MKNLKKLIPALCLLLISAMLLGTSTFAWFTMNTKVSASDLAVKATTGGNLLIALPDGDKAPAVSAFKTSITFTAAAKELSPASTVDLTNWFATTAGEVGKSAKGTNADYKATTDYLNEKFYLYAGDVMDIYTSELTATIQKGEGDPIDVLTDGNAPLWNSLRIGIKVGTGNDATFCIYALTAATADGSDRETTTGTDANAIGVKKTDTGADTAKINTDANTKIFHAITGDDADKGFKLGTLQKNAVTEAHVYIWFEGTDGACYTNNYQDLNVTIGFELAQLTATTA